MNITPEQVKQLLENATQVEWVDDGSTMICAESDQLNNGYCIVEYCGKDAKYNAALIAAAPSIAKAYLEAMEKLEVAREALKPKVTNDMKAVCIGEFNIETKQTCSACYFNEPQEECEVCGGEVEYTESTGVPWTMMKDIYKMMQSVRAKEAYTKIGEDT